MNSSSTYYVCKRLTFFADIFLLKGTLHLPTGVRRPPPIIIGLHGLLSNSDSPKQISLAMACNKAGIGFFRFDHRGCGESEGCFEDITSLKSRSSDLICAIQMIQERNDTGDRIGVFGSSMGGAVALSVANQAKIATYVTFAAPVRSAPIVDAIESAKHPNIPEFAKTHLCFDISNNLSEIRNILIFHGDSDEVVPFAHAKEIYEKVGHPKKLIIQKQGDHRMSNKVHQETFIQETLNWFKKYL